MRRNLFLVTLVLAFSLVSAVFQCENCVCTDRNAAEGLKRGTFAPICIHMITENTVISKTVNAIGVDDFSAITITKAQETFVNDALIAQTNAELRIVVQTDTQHISTSLPYVKVTNSEIEFYTNLFSLVIEVTDGLVTNLIWDNDCGLCEGLTCEQRILEDETPTNLCNVNTACNATTPVTTCDPRLYVTWIGTDVDGNSMTSAGLRLSQFVKYSITGLFNKAENIITNIS